MDESTFRKLKELLMCAICYDPIVNGISLDPCQHLFCSYCFFTSKRPLCPLCNVQVTQTHNCSRLFMNNLSELTFGPDYRESAMSKLKAQYEENMKKSIIATLPVIRNPSPLVIQNPQPLMRQPNIINSFPKLWNNYVILGSLLILMAIFMIINSVYLSRINEKLSL